MLLPQNSNLRIPLLRCFQPMKCAFYAINIQGFRSFVDDKFIKCAVHKFFLKWQPKYLCICTLNIFFKINPKPNNVENFPARKDLNV